MGFFLAKLVGLLLDPGFLLQAGLLLGVLLLYRRGRGNGRGFGWGRGLVTLALLVLLFFDLVPLPRLLLEPLENRFAANPSLPEHIDGIIVLGGAVELQSSQARGKIAVNSAVMRLIEGAELARKHPEAKLLFTGGTGDPLRPEPREAPYAAQLLRQFGTPEGQLLIEDASRNTYENAIYSQRLVQPQPGQTWVLVTSARHMPRAMGVFRAVGWKVIPWPVDYLTSGESSDLLRPDFSLDRIPMTAFVLHEWGGLAFYKISGWSDGWFPGP